MKKSGHELTTRKRPNLSMSMDYSLKTPCDNLNYRLEEIKTRSKSTVRATPIQQYRRNRSIPCKAARTELPIQQSGSSNWRCRLCDPYAHHDGSARR